MGKRAITVYSINVDTESMVNMGLNLKYISEFNSPFLKVGKGNLQLLFFLWSRHFTSVALKDCTLNWIAKYL